MGRRILAVDDEDSILGVVRLNLENEGFEVHTAPDGAHALALVAEKPFDMAILDIMLPDIDGFELARTIRQSSDMPIMMLSARDTDIDKAVGLGVGADDYLTKPFSPIELVARVKAHLRRYGQSATAPASHDPEVIEAGPVRLDPMSRTATVRGESVELTAKEFDLLALLAAHKGRAYTKEQIYATVWGEHWGGDYSTVQVHIRRLRSKVEVDASDPRYIKTIWGIGYRFDAEATV